MQGHRLSWPPGCPAAVLRATVWVSMMMASAPASTSAWRLLLECSRDLGFARNRRTAPSDRRTVRYRRARSPPGRRRLRARSNRGPVDLGDLVGLRMAIEHDARTAERVGDDAIGPGLGVAPLDGQHALRMGQVPCLAAVALFRPASMSWVPMAPSPSNGRSAMASSIMICSWMSRWGWGGGGGVGGRRGGVFCCALSLLVFLVGQGGGRVGGGGRWFRGVGFPFRASLGVGAGRGWGGSGGRRSLVHGRTAVPGTNVSEP